MKISLGEYCIRNYEDRDVPSIARHANNRKVWRTLAELPHPYTEADAKWWIEHVRNQEQETHFAIADSEEAFGSIGFSFGKGMHGRSVEMGYWIGEAYWGQGIVSQVARAFIEYIFENYPKIVRIQAEVFEGNIASGRVLEKAGLTLEARLRKSIFKDQKLLDAMIYAILRQEWEIHTKT